MHWFSGVVSACLILPLWANWVSDGNIRLCQKGIGVPFFVGLLSGVTLSIAFIVRGEEWGASSMGVVLCTGVAVLVTIVKSIRGTLITKEEAEED